MNTEKGLIYVVIPALNEERNLELCLPLLVSLYQVIVVDNGSTDSTSAVAKKYGALVLFCARKGYGSAVNAAFKHILANSQPRSEQAQKECVVVFDADAASPVESIAELIFPILNNEADLVIAQRSTQERGAMPFHARFGNVLQTSLIGLLTGTKYLDMGPLRALSVDAVRRLNMLDPTWGWNVEMQVKAALFRFKIKEIKIIYKKRMFGKSKISGSVMGSLRAGFRIIWAVFWYFTLAHQMARSQKNEFDERFIAHVFPWRRKT